jgi:hypothetical protein
MENEFRFNSAPCLSGDGRITVGVNIENHYDRSLALYLEMEKILRGKIPFTFEVTEGPKVCILDGGIRKGMAQLEMTIRSTNPDVSPMNSLEEAGFGKFIFPSFPY